MPCSLKKQNIDFYPNLFDMRWYNALNVRDWNKSYC